MSTKRQDDIANGIDFDAMNDNTTHLSHTRMEKY